MMIGEKVKNWMLSLCQTAQWKDQGCSGVGMHSFPHLFAPSNVTWRFTLH